MMQPQGKTQNTQFEGKTRTSIYQDAEIRRADGDILGSDYPGVSLRPPGSRRNQCLWYLLNTTQLDVDQSAGTPFPEMGIVSAVSYGLFSTQQLTLPVWDSPERLFWQAIALKNTTLCILASCGVRWGQQQQGEEHGVMAGSYSETSPGGRPGTMDWWLSFICVPHNTPDPPQSVGHHLHNDQLSLVAHPAFLVMPIMA